MTDRHVEDKLRDCWNPKPPDDMWERTVMRARRESAERRAKSQILWMSGWKAALAFCGVLIVVLTNISDSARQERIGEMVWRPSANAPQTQIAHATSPQEWESRQVEILDRLHEIEGTDAL